MTPPTFMQVIRRALGLALLLFCVNSLLAQTPVAPPAGARGVIKLRVRVAGGDGTKAKGLARKRFFLIKGSLAENKALFDALEQQPVVSRDCYYRGIGASEALIKWLKESDCESVYCREIEAKDIDGPTAVPEFQKAVADGEKEYGSRDVARQWAAVNLPENIRDGFYKRQQQQLQAVLKQAEERSHAKVYSIMTDRNGAAYFTDLDQGTYVLSNIIPSEFGTVTELWKVELQVKPGDLATEKYILIANLNNKDPRDKKNIKPGFVSVEKPLPACAK